MQPTESLSVPRRVLDVEDYIDIARRHRGWVFGPFLFTVVAAVVGIYFWPDSYESRAVIRILPQQVPINMVQPAVNQDMGDRISAMSQSILSRAQLTGIINSLGLYPRERSRMPIEDLVEEMRTKKIQIYPVNSISSGNQQKAVPAFVIQFSYENRLLAQKVVQELVSKFLDESVRNRSNATFQTTQFLRDQADQARKELDDIENRLTTFRVQNNGRLPDQVDGNLRSLQALQATMAYLTSSVNRAQQEKMQLESSLRITRDQHLLVSKEPQEQAVIQQKSDRIAEFDRDILSLENQLAVFRQRYTEKNPDVQSLRDRLAVARKRREVVLQDEAADKKDPGPPPVNQALVREARDLSVQVQRTESAIAAKQVEIEQYDKDLKRTNEAVNAYQSRIESIPLGEKQYGDLLRDREMAKGKYMQLDANLAKAQIAQDMEGRKQGENLDLLDPPSLPQKPVEPNRPMVISIGAGIGLLLGVVLAGAREMKDGSLKNLKDVRAYTQLPILGSVPLLENDFVVRRRKRLAWLGWTTTCLAAAVTMSGAVIYYYVTRT